jgi:hypothetical protein
MLHISKKKQREGRMWRYMEGSRYAIPFSKPAVQILDFSHSGAKMRKNFVTWAIRSEEV